MAMLRRIQAALGRVAVFAALLAVAVRLLAGVVVAAGLGAVGGGRVAELVDVHRVLLVGRETGDFTVNVNDAVHFGEAYDASAFVAGGGLHDGDELFHDLAGGDGMGLVIMTRCITA